MKLAKFAFLIACIVLFANCKKEEVPTTPIPIAEEEIDNPDNSNEEVYFSLEVIGAFFSFPDQWIIIHDSSGNLIDYKSTKDLQFVEFKAAKDSVPENFNVTTLSIDLNESAPYSYHFLSSYTDIKKGSIWYEDFATKATPGQSFDGTFDINIENVPGIERLNVFTPDGRINTIDDSIVVENDQSMTLTLKGVFLHENNDYLINIYDSEGNSKYMKMRPKENDKIKVDYTNFQEFDTYLEKELPKSGQYSLYIAGYLEEDPNYYSTRGLSEFGTSLNWGYATDLSIHGGYIDAFEKFKTDFSVDWEDYSYGYLVNGPKVIDIPILEKPSLEIINDGYKDFKFSTDQNFKRKIENWNYTLKNELGGSKILTEWTIYSSNGDRTEMGEIPTEILEEYEYFNLGDVTLKSLSLYTQSESYDEWLTISKKSLEERKEGVKEYVRFNF